MICNNLLTFIGHFNMCDLPPPSRPLNGTDLVARVMNPAAFWYFFNAVPSNPPSRLLFPRQVFLLSLTWDR